MYQIVVVGGTNITFERCTKNVLLRNGVCMVVIFDTTTVSYFQNCLVICPKVKHLYLFVQNGGYGTWKMFYRGTFLVNIQKFSIILVAVILSNFTMNWLLHIEVDVMSRNMTFQ